MKQIAIFASGEGTNAQHIIDHFKGVSAGIVLLVCNNPKANVIKRAEKEGIPVLLVNKTTFYSGEDTIKRLLNDRVDLIVCAGFLWKIPDNILKAFPNKIVNIHPALLPKFGGRGMYGINVHKAVIEADEKKSGITIHYLNERYDEGKIILQKKCDIQKGDTPEMLAQKVQALEYEWYPKTIAEILAPVPQRGGDKSR